MIMNPVHKEHSQVTRPFLDSLINHPNETTSFPAAHSQRSISMLIDQGIGPAHYCQIQGRACMLELLRRGPFCAGAALHDEEHNERRPVHGTIAHDACPPGGQSLSIHLPAGDAIPGVLCPRLFRHPFLQHRRSYRLKQAVQQGKATLSMQNSNLHLYIGIHLASLVGIRLSSSNPLACLLCLRNTWQIFLP